MHNDFQRPAEDEITSDDLPEHFTELEISDLPPAERSHYLLLRLTRWREALPRWRFIRKRPARPLTRSQRRQAIGRTLTAFGMGAILLVLLLGSAPGLRARLTSFLHPTPVDKQVNSLTFTSMPVIIMRPGDQQPSNYPKISPGALPASCPQISTLQYFMTPLDPPGLGASPVWFSGFNGPSATLNNLTPIDAPVVHAPWPTGWYATLAVFIQKGYNNNITLQGNSQTSGSPIWLSKDSPQILSSSLTLNLNDGSRYITDGQWEMTSITIAVPKAGCYKLQVSEASTLWTRYFAAGA